MGKIGLIARREFNERVKKKSFIITTILTPVLFLGIMALTIWMSMKDLDREREILVVDRSGIIAPGLDGEGMIKYTVADSTTAVDEDNLRETAPEGVFGVLIIDEDIMTNPRAAHLYAFESSTMTVEQAVADRIRETVETEKLKSYDIENLSEILAEVKTPISLQVKEISESGEAEDSSSTLSMITGYIFGFLIYMFIILYGSMVMQGVIEEKSNKVLELIVSSVKPFQLMMGKILGIASVAFTQLLIWVVFFGLVGGGILNFFAGDMMSALAASGADALAAGTDAGLPAGLTDDTAVLLRRLTDVRFITTMIIGFVIYFIGGYLFYSAMFAAVGSAVDNEKDTQNLQLPITIPLILAIIVMAGAMQDPGSPTAFWFSIIPFTSPVVMMARLPYGVPTWELALSVGLLYVTFIAVVWLAGKIYRVGIFMYGKKPSFKELYKWMRYKY